MCELKGVLSVALAGAIGDDRAGGRGEGNEGILIAGHSQVFATDVFLLAADKCPQLVQLQPANAQAVHGAVMKGSAASADANTKAHDGVAVNARKALNGADAHALGESGDDLDLLVAGKVVHGGSSPTVWECDPPSGKMSQLTLYCAKRSFSSGSSPGVDDPGPALFAQCRSHSVDDGGSGEERTHGTLGGGWKPKRPPRGKLGAISRSATLPNAKTPHPRNRRWGVCLFAFPASCQHYTHYASICNRMLDLPLENYTMLVSERGY